MRSLPTLMLLRAAGQASLGNEPWQIVEELLAAWRRKPAPLLGAALVDIARTLPMPALSLTELPARPTISAASAVRAAFRASSSEAVTAAVPTLLSWER